MASICFWPFAEAEKLMYNGNRLGTDPKRGGILNSFDWCCWNPLKVRWKCNLEPTMKALLMRLKRTYDMRL